MLGSKQTMRLSSLKVKYLMNLKKSTNSIFMNHGFIQIKKEENPMATKGASNRYGNSRGGKQGFADKKISFSWTRDFNKINSINIMTIMVEKWDFHQKNLINNMP